MISKTKLNKEAQRKNSELKGFIFKLKNSKNEDYLKIARYLALPRRKTIIVNLDKINKYSKEKDIILVPGKVLGKGNLNHKIELIAFRIGESAEKKVKESGSTFKNLIKFVKEGGKKFKIII